ncbi:hypothetical protein G6O67_002124 [Ophiocordyceps sinensis]|uniref:Uncharacterized protein n=1 Tax=Ophiocordyceps sinensis TaxID=72228 RepID=A0A8H4PTL7_9HYPO|nr:hypothetical protein G6O67_002124 [Ophiocordyceps sinensis]
MDQTLKSLDKRLAQTDKRLDQIDKRLNQIDQRLGQIDHGVQQGKQMASASNKNSTARFRNTEARKLDDPVSTLYNVVTGERVSRFPRRVRDLMNLSDDRVDSIMEELGEPTRLFLLPALREKA